jgi:2-oxoglutarate ferredoxin oxidoreductase subunit gamma
LQRTEIRIAGLGGQGVVLAGQILGRAAAYSGKNVVQTQSYGAEARGSGAKSEIIVSEDRIGFPMVRKCDILIVMSQEAVERNIGDLKEKGVLLVDSSMIEKTPETNVRILRIPASKIAEETVGEKLAANMVMLGALVTATAVVDKPSIEKAISEVVPKKARAPNIQAFKVGLKL